MSSEDKIVAAIDRNTAATTKTAYHASIQRACIVSLLVLILLQLSCPRAKAAPLVSDGDEIASVGTVQVITPHALPERKI